MRSHSGRCIDLKILEKSVGDDATHRKIRGVNSILIWAGTKIRIRSCGAKPRRFHKFFWCQRPHDVPSFSHCIGVYMIDTFRFLTLIPKRCYNTKD